MNQAQLDPWISSINERVRELKRYVQYWRERYEEEHEKRLAAEALLRERDEVCDEV